MPLSAYRSGIRSAVRALWLGAMDYFQFYEAMDSAIRLGFNQAWREGAKECGIEPAEYTQAERTELERAIVNEHDYIERLGADIEQHSRANGGLLTPLFNRAEAWINHYTGIQNQARVMACGDRKLKWVLGEAEHCSSCLKLNGKVKRGSYWNEHGILPRIPAAGYLECRGYRCQCDLVETDEPLSRGPLPSLP